MRYDVYFRGSQIDPVDSNSSTEDLQAVYDSRDPTHHNQQGRVTVVPSKASRSDKDAARKASRGITYCYDYHVEGGREAKYDADCKASGYTQKTVIEWPSKHAHSPRPVRCYVYSFGDFDDENVRKFLVSFGSPKLTTCTRYTL